MLDAGRPVLESALKSAFSLGMASSSTLASEIIGAGLLAVISMGQFPSVPSPIPLVPSGISAAKSMIKQAFSLGPAATPELSAQMITAGVVASCSMIPPAGVSSLQSAIKSAFSNKDSADKTTSAQKMSSAIITYYKTGGGI